MAVSPWTKLKRLVVDPKPKWKANTIEACDWVCGHRWHNFPEYSRYLGSFWIRYKLVSQCLNLAVAAAHEIVDKLGVEGYQLIKNFETPPWLIADKIDECVQLPRTTETLRSADNEDSVNLCLEFLTKWLGIKRVTY